MPSNFPSEALGFEVLYFDYPRLSVTNFAAGDNRPVRKLRLEQTLEALAGALIREGKTVDRLRTTFATIRGRVVKGFAEEGGRSVERREGVAA